MSNLRRYATIDGPSPPGTRPGAGRTRLSRSGVLFDVLIGAIPCLLFLEITIVGRLFASEIILLGLFPFVLIAKGRLLIAPLPRTLITLGLIWLGGQIVTDIIRDTPFQDYSRGWAKISFTLVNFAVIYMLLHNNQRRILFFAVGLVIGGILDYYISPGELAAGDPWKFALGAPVTLLIVLVAERCFARSVPRVVSAVMAAAAGVNLVMGFRSLAGICFLTAVYILLQWHRSRPRLRVSGRRLAFLSILGIVASVGFVETYGYAARQGMLGPVAQSTYETQVASQFGLILGGRTEILVAGQAILDSPIIGHGSWAKGAEYARLLMEYKGFLPWTWFMARHSEIIPSHSHLFGAWVEAGILGVFFWGFVMLLAFRVLLHFHQLREDLTPLVIFICFVVLWDVLFSPFGAERRILAPYYIVVLMYAWDVVLAYRRTQIAQPRAP